MCNDIIKFFSGIKMLPNEISVLTDERGRPSGEAFIKFALASRAKEVLQKHGKMIGNRYIKVFQRVFLLCVFMLCVVVT